MKLLSRVRLFETPWTAAYQAPLPMGLSRQECWSGLPLPSPQSEWTSLKSLQIPNAGEGVGEKEPSCTVGGNVRWCCHCGKQHGGSLKKLKVELPHDPEVPVLGISTKDETLIQRDTCIPLFTTALLTTAKTWKQPKCPSTGEWVEKGWCL